MPRRLNYTNRRRITRDDVSVRLYKQGEDLLFDANLNLQGYELDKITPPPSVHVEAYRGASALWKRFDFGLVNAVQHPKDRTLREFGVPEGILFRVKVAMQGGEAVGRLIAEADALRPLLPNEQEGYGQPLIQHVAADDMGDELWRLDFDGIMPLLKINIRVPMGVDQFLRDPRYRAVFAPAVMRGVLTRILIVERDVGDETDETDWRQRWLNFSRALGGVPDPVLFEPEEANLEAAEEWIDTAVEAFTARSGLLTGFTAAGAGDDKP